MEWKQHNRVVSLAELADVAKYKKQSFRLLAAMESVKPAPKRLIICCDGTWQSSVSGKRNIPSNVVRLARTIAKAGKDADGKEWQQMVFYDSGVGTGSLSWLEQARQGGTGDGLVINVLEAYNFLVNNYNPGDQIFCFGFSRGAFTARAIAGLVTDIGVFKPNNMQSFAPLWSVYQKNTAKHEFRKTKEWYQFVNGVRAMVPKGQENKPYIRKPWEVAHASDVDGSPLTWENSNVVEVVGVFDTVGSLGMADTRLMNHAASRKRFEYLNVKLSPFIKHAFHALSLDDHREPFLPTLWYIPSPETMKIEEATIDHEDDDWPELKAYRDAVDKEISDHQVNNPPDLYQVWFPGVHINIGGGSDEESVDDEGLSNLTFAWMVQQLGPYLAFEPWTWGKDGIVGYQARVIREENMYNAMKSGMSVEEKKEFSGLIHKSTVENVEDTAAEWGHWIWENAKKTLALSKGVKMVPVPPENIKPPDAALMGNDGKPIKLQWGISKYTDSYTAMYKLISNPVNRAPGESNDRSREGGKPLRQLGRTNEYIHPSVWWRYKTMKNAKGDVQYTSKSLNGFKRLQDPKYGSYGYWKDTTKVWIPEWFMRPCADFLVQQKYDEYVGPGEDQAWQHAEWTYAENVDGKDDLQPDLAKFYVAAQDARKKMKSAGKEFPWDIQV